MIEKISRVLNRSPLRYAATLLISSLIFSGSPFAFSQNALEQNWPQFRGHDSTGVSSNRGLPDQWSATENVEWKREIAGRGWGSPIVWGDKVFLTSVINTGESEPVKKGLYFGGDRPAVPKSIHEWKVYCLELTTGKIEWEQTVKSGAPSTPIHLKNSYASETPVTDGKHLYVCFGNVGLFCFDFDGKIVWKKELAPHPTRFGWGTAASPVIHEDVLYYVGDNDEASSMLAIDKLTGETKWSIERDEKSNWSTPFIWKNEKRTEIVTAGTGAIRSYDLKGNLLWSLKGMSSITIATPYVCDGLLYVSSGYVMDKVKAMYAIKQGAQGDLTLPKEQSSSDYVVWSNMKIAPYNPSTLVHNDRLFVLYDRGTVGSYRAKTGEPIYENQRLPRGGSFTSSPWSYDGKIFCLNEDGLCAVLRESDSLDVLHTNTLAEDDLCLSTPAIAGDRLLIRSDKRLYCIRRAQPTPTTITYKKVGDRELKMFVDKPSEWKDSDKRPAIVFYFGGGWVGGSPTQFEKQSQYLASRGMVGIRVEYRVIPKGDEGPPTICCNDAKSAMRYVRSHAADLGVDPMRIAAAGGSAGGHLAAFTTLVPGIDDPQDDLKVSCKANALVLFNPVFNNGPDQWGHKRVGERYREFSPTHHVTKEAPPTTVFLGDQDKLIPVSVLRDFEADMKKAGVRCDAHVYEKAGHGFFNKDTKEGDWFSQTLVETDKFLASLGWLTGEPNYEKR